MGWLLFFKIDKKIDKKRRKCIERFSIHPRGGFCIIKAI
jgi:hypothetical protein